MGILLPRWAMRMLAVGAVVYVVLLAALFIFQRRLMYFPEGPAGAPSAWGLPDAKALKLGSQGGRTIVAWYQSAKSGKPLFVYFHGNGGTLPIRADYLGRLASDGSGFLAIDYSGYGGSTGSPNERNLLEGGRAAYAEARSLGYDAGRIVIIGESLGTGVAVAVAADNPVGALVLDSAFSSTVDVAAAHYWMFPVRLLMRDTFKSSALIGRVTAPKLFLHGTEDDIIPIAFDRKLFAAAVPPKRFVAVPGRGHIVLGAPEAIAEMRTWLAGLQLGGSPKATPTGSAPSPRR